MPYAIYLLMAIGGLVGWLVLAYLECRDEAEPEATPLVSAECALLSRSPDQPP